MSNLQYTILQIHIKKFRFICRHFRRFLQFINFFEFFQNRNFVLLYQRFRHRFVFFKKKFRFNHYLKIISWTMTNNNLFHIRCCLQINRKKKFVQKFVEKIWMIEKKNFRRDLRKIKNDQILSNVTFDYIQNFKWFLKIHESRQYRLSIRKIICDNKFVNNFRTNYSNIFSFANHWLKIVVYIFVIFDSKFDDFVNQIVMNFRIIFNHDTISSFFDMSMKFKN